MGEHGVPVSGDHDETRQEEGCDETACEPQKRMIRMRRDVPDALRPSECTKRSELARRTKVRGRTWGVHVPRFWKRHLRLCGRVARVVLNRHRCFVRC